MKSKVSSILCLVIFNLNLLSCHRSSQYRKEESFAKSDSGLGAVKRIESTGQPKKKLFVFNFWNDTPVRNDQIGAYAADELRRGLFLTKRVILPTDLQTHSSTKDFVNGDQIRVGQLLKEGKRLGVALVVIGRIKKITYRQSGDEIGLLREKQAQVGIEIEIKAFDSVSNREILATSSFGEASSKSFHSKDDHDIESVEYKTELIQAATKLAVSHFLKDIVQSVEKQTWQGRIVKVVGQKIYVSAGKESGLVIGDILRVLAPGDDIYDPLTGASLGRTKGRLKGTLEILDLIGMDGAISELHSGASFQEGDLVELY